MQPILYIDIEASRNSDIKEYGLVYEDKELKTSSLDDVKDFFNTYSPNYIAGHNFINFDMRLLNKTSFKSFLDDVVIIDTLPSSLLFFNEKTFHKIPKMYKNEDVFLNDPVKDSLLTRELFEKIVKKFLELPKHQQYIFYTLLKAEVPFKGFFEYVHEHHPLEEFAPNILEASISKVYDKVIQNKYVLKKVIKSNKIELSYILALLTPVTEIKAHPPKVLFDYPEIIEVQKQLCFNLEKSSSNLSAFAEEVFGFGSFRSFKRLEEESLFAKGDLSQKEIVEAALNDESFIAVLPTGGGKTFTFWLPSLIKASSYKSLTVIISPLQALIKDHLESFEKQVANYTAVAISGFLSPLERANAIDKVISGEADILYLAPESLRSNAIFSMLKNRLIERFVIDEAHCLSTWGNDFRHDYFYIGEFIKDLLAEKSYQKTIPISCFTATGKPNVLDDISNYIYGSLGLELSKHLAIPQRNNLDYEAFSVIDKKEKYTNLLKLVNDKDEPTLIYIPSSTSTCDEIAQQLSIDTGKNIRSFHSKLETDVKMQILSGYVNNEIDVVVATTAFGMGVDKANILNVIHYETSDSLENYAQEAGRGARDQELRAFCPLLFDESDLDKHFVTLNRTKISADEINAVFRVLKDFKQNPLLKTTREIAQAAHWDVEDNNSQYDMKIKTSLLELEREGYLERKRNRVRYFGDSVATDSLERLHKEIEENNYDQESAIRLKRILQTILGRGKPQAVQVDELAMLLGYEKQDIAEALLILKELKIISESKDMSLIISREIITKYQLLLDIERALFNYLKSINKGSVSIRELNEVLIDKGVIKAEQNRSSQIKEALKFWRYKEVFQFYRVNRSKDVWAVNISDIKLLQENNKEKHHLSKRIIDYFLKDVDKSTSVKKFDIEFSIFELKKAVEFDGATKTLEKVLLYLHEMKLLELSQGRFIYYSPMSLHKTEKVKQKIKYTKAEYEKRMSKHYQQKIESIHIMGEYAHRLLKNKKEATEFMKDYFVMDFDNFKKKYKLGNKISQPLTQKKFEQIYNNLSDEQQMIMQDKTSQGIMILAGPGSGKTKVLTHKIAALILNEDVKPEQFLMLTYSRTAMMEFKSRLFSLIGPMALEVDIATFHGYALQLIARQVEHDNSELLQNVIRQATKQINNNEVEIPFKTVLVLDEYQDINEDGFAFVRAIYESLLKEIRIIAVGDDDQCIMQHTNGANVEFIDKFKELFEDDSFTTYELLNNFRSDTSLVEYTQGYISTLSKRYKQHPLVPNSKKQGYIEFIHTKSKYLVEPTINLCKSNSFEGSTILLAHTNNEVISIYSYLRENGFDVKYLLDNDGYKLRNLIEIYEFDRLLNLEDEINEDILYKVLNQVKGRYSESKNYKKIEKLVRLFIKNNEYLTFSIWDEFLDEIDSSVLMEQAQFNISTIHKAKGKEFDNVIMMMQSVKQDDYHKRLYYVGMTRAKHNLYMVSNDRKFSNIDSVGMKVVDDNKVYSEPRILTVLMTLKDINLGFEGNYQAQGKALIAGTEVKLVKKFENYPRVLMIENKYVAQLSNAFEKKILEKEEKGYIISGIEVEAVVHWENIGKNVLREHPICKIVLKID